MDFMIDNLTLMEAVFDNRLMQLNYQFDRIMMEHKENLGAIEYKVLCENGTDDDLCGLYTAEAEEVKQKSQGVLTSIINAVKAFFRKIRDLLFGKKIDEDAIQGDVEVPEDPDAVLKEGRGALARLKAFLKGHGKQIAVGAGVAAATAGAVVIAKNKVIPYIKSMQGYMEDSEAILDEAAKPGATDNLTPEQQEGVKKAVNDVKKSGSKISGIMKKFNKAAGLSSEEREYRKTQKIVDKSKQTRERIDRSLESMKTKNTEDEALLKKLNAGLKQLEQKSGIQKSFANGLFNKHERTGRKIKALKEKIDSGNYTDADMDQYTDLLRTHGQDSAKYSSEIKKLTAEINQIQQRISGRNQRMSDLNAKREKTVQTQRDAAERGSNLITNRARRDAQAIKESTVLVETANAEVDYFINSLL